MKRTVALLPLVLGLVASCGKVSQGVPTTSDAVRAAFVEDASNLTQSENIKKLDTDNFSKLAGDTCDPKEGGPEAAAVAAAFLPVLIDLVFDQIAKKLAEEIREYTTAYKGRAQTDGFYRDLKARKPAAFCLQLIREATGDRDPEMELVLEMETDKNSLYIRPVRFYFGQPGSKNKAGADRWAIAADMTVTSRWLSASGEGIEKVLYQGPILRKRIAVDGALAPQVTYADLSLDVREDKDAVSMPLPALGNRDVGGRNAASGTVIVEVNVVETGTNNALEFAQSVFGRVRGPSNKLLTDAIGQLID